VFELLLTASAVLAGAVAAVAGFGIGSILTPVFAQQVDTKLAVAAVSIPHIVGTAFRLWLLGVKPDRRVLWSFGLTSAAGGLIGALLHGRLSSPPLTIVFGALLLFVGISGLTGLASRIRFDGAASWVAGAVSGFLGGLVGNQGGIRSGALLGFEMEKTTFIATATAIGLFVDAARMPVYFWTAGGALTSSAGAIALGTAGVVVGTVAGNRLLARVPERTFRPIVAALVGTLGAYMIVRGIGRP
jgi:uncharacterized membrane protein YfcA